VFVQTQIILHFDFYEFKYAAWWSIDSLVLNWSHHTDTNCQWKMQLEKCSCKSEVLFRYFYTHNSALPKFLTCSSIQSKVEVRQD
jgi:hypothetical protein